MLVLQLGAKPLKDLREGKMQRRLWRLSIAIVLGCFGCGAWAQTSWTWQQVKKKFVATNPTLKANQLGIDESRAAEITAFLRPNPDLTLAMDGLQPAPNNGLWRPLSGSTQSPAVSYLHERQHKRELRLASAKQSSAITESTYLDQERGLLFTLRNAFVQTLEAKAFLQNAIENLNYWDRELAIFRKRYQAGDLAQVDLARLELQRLPFESDYETALVNLRTAKIQLLTLMNDRTPIEGFDVDGPFEFSDQLLPLEEYRRVALEGRPDLKAAVQNVELAKINHQLAVANGSTDPTFTGWFTNNGSFSNPLSTRTIGGSVSIPLRIFDRNQGEKVRTQIDIGRNERLFDAAKMQVFSDVDSAYWTLVQAVNLLKPYTSKYLELAVDTRNKVSFSYEHGGASLLDYLDAEKAYRDTRLSYLNLIGAYLTAAAQMNQAVGREAI
jgi:cobalt-zinc-cadmium efflux system outer membrane protein